MARREDDSDPLEEQQMLVETSLPLVFASHDEAVERRVRQPVVILLDCQDEIGGQIARAWLGDEAIDDATALRDEGEETTVFAYAFAWNECCSQVPEVFPYLAPVFEDAPPQEGFLVVSVTSGGASAIIVPQDARP